MRRKSPWDMICLCAIPVHAIQLHGGWTANQSPLHQSLPVLCAFREAPRHLSKSFHRCCTREDCNPG